MQVDAQVGARGLRRWSFEAEAQHPHRPLAQPPPHTLEVVVPKDDALAVGRQGGLRAGGGTRLSASGPVGSSKADASAQLG